MYFIINDFTNIGSWRQFVRANTVRPYIRPFSSDNTMIIAWIGSGIMQYGIDFCISSSTILSISDHGGNSFGRTQFAPT
ncbi:MAG: hypothetical protein RSA55_08180, partial [Clostridia bacterium]